MRSLRLGHVKSRAQLLQRSPRGLWDCTTPDFAKQKAVRFMPTGRRPPPRQDGPSPPRSHSDPRLREQPPIGASFLNITRDPQPSTMRVSSSLAASRQGAGSRQAQCTPPLPCNDSELSRPPGRAGSWGNKGPDAGAQDRKVLGAIWRLRTDGPAAHPMEGAQSLLASRQSQRNLLTCSLQPALSRAQCWHVVMRLPGKPRVPAVCGFYVERSPRPALLSLPVNADGVLGTFARRVLLQVARMPSTVPLRWVDIPRRLGISGTHT